jgi:ADP-heptose:LPS heptosyltransferase
MPDAWPQQRLLESGAAARKVAEPAPYVYKAAWKRMAARSLDAMGQGLFWPCRRNPTPAWQDLKKVAVLRLDHLGDVVHCLPALQLLRAALPKAEITLVVGPWGRGAAELSKAPHKVMVVDAPWFKRPQREAWPWQALDAFAHQLRAGGFDAAFEMRGDLRHHWALWKAGIPFSAGLSVTAGGFLLSRSFERIAGAHEQVQNAATLIRSGLPLTARQGLQDYERLTPYAKLTLPAAAQAEASKLWKQLKLQGKVVAVQAACGTQAKRWPAPRWADLLSSLPRGWHAVLLGSPDEQEEMQALARQCRKAPAMATGRLSLHGLAAFLSRCQAMLSVDSGPAHLGAALGLPVLVLWSGTNVAAQWMPRGPKVRLVSGAATPCSPCELAQCPYDNTCMQRLELAMVKKEMLKLFEAACAF